MRPTLPARVWDTARARIQVAQRLGLRYHDRMQDWPWEVAEPAALASYVQLYTQTPDAEERVVLMEMMLQAASEQPTPEALAPYWPRIKTLLDHDASLQAWVVLYWCVWRGNEPDERFTVSPYLREWWTANYDVPKETLADYF